MIFVNDLWSLREVPRWLDHVAAGVDGMGLADVVFPMFLFIVGLSIPFAFQNRLAKGATSGNVLMHIFSRSIALLIMGLCHVNLENYNHELALLPKPVWQILATIAFFLIWLDYPKEGSRIRKNFGQIAGWVLLALLLAVFRGGSAEDPVWMRLYWWGILGLIGWAYLISSVVYLVFRGKLAWMWAIFLGFMVFSMLSKMGMLTPLLAIKPYVWLIDDGATPALTMAGILASLHYQKHRKGWTLYGWMLPMAGLLLALGIATRPIWGIHKIGSSPSWVLISIAASIVVFCLLVWLVEEKNKRHWFDLIRPAGTSTLTCYLLPYIHYGLLTLVGISLPLVLRTGPVGLLKSLLYALMIIWITGWLERRRIRLKI